jgi:nucleoid-associated protein YgaU
MAGETERDQTEPSTPDGEKPAAEAAATSASPEAAPAQAPIGEAAQPAAGAAEKLSPEAKAAAAEKAKAAAAAKAKAAAAAKAKADEGPPRALPSQEDIARWAAGGDANVGILFEGLALARFDTFVTKIRNEEIVPQHWQVITALRPPDDAEFERLPEVGRLRQVYKDHTVARRRLDAMKIAWRELRGKRPSLWAVPDLLAAMRRIIAKQVAVDWNDLLTVVRDLWLSSPMPAGKEQVEILWAALSLVRDGTKK